MWERVPGRFILKKEKIKQEWEKKKKDVDTMGNEFVSNDKVLNFIADKI